MRLLSFMLFGLCSIVQADNTFIHPSSWGIPDDDHYNLYQEDDNHPCNIGGPKEDASQCEDWTKRTPDNYVKRDCGYGGQCSAKTKGVHHAGIDYDYPYHEHDQRDYTNGQRNLTDLHQGGDRSLPYHNGDDIIAMTEISVIVEDHKVGHLHI